MKVTYEVLNRDRKSGEYATPVNETLDVLGIKRKEGRSLIYETSQCAGFPVELEVISGHNSGNTRLELFSTSKDSLENASTRIRETQGLVVRGLSSMGLLLS